MVCNNKLTTIIYAAYYVQLVEDRPGVRYGFIDITFLKLIDGHGNDILVHKSLDFMRPK